MAGAPLFAIKVISFRLKTMPGHEPRHDTHISPAAIASIATIRMTRQQVLLRDNSLRFTTVLDEAVLRRQVGGSDVAGVAFLENMTSELFIERKDEVYRYGLAFRPVA